jgi:hypothetical protein
MRHARWISATVSGAVAPARARATRSSAEGSALVVSAFVCPSTTRSASASMFAGSDDGARRAAILYAVISTAVLCGVEPWANVRDPLEKISSGFPQRRIDDLLPDAWGLLHAEARLRRDPAAAPAA